MLLTQLIPLLSIAVLTSASSFKRVTCPDSKHTATNAACCVFFDLADELQQTLLGNQCGEDGVCAVIKPLRKSESFLFFLQPSPPFNLLSRMLLVFQRQAALVKGPGLMGQYFYSLTLNFKTVSIVGTSSQHHQMLSRAHICCIRRAYSCYIL